MADPGTDRNVISGNYVGTNAAGTAPLGNNGVPIAVVNGPDDTRIGTDGDGQSDTEERNVTSGNVWEILVEGLGTDRTVIAGNYIGLDATGTVALGNGELQDGGTPFSPGCCHAGVFVMAPANTVRNNVVSGHSAHNQNPGIRSGGSSARSRGSASCCRRNPG